MAEKRDYYEVLGVARDASADEIKRAFKKIAVANHPDRNPGDEEALARFKEASEAYDVLRDPDKRARYDRHGHAGVDGAGFTDLGDIFERFGDLGDLFGGLFGGRRSRRGGGGARRGETLATTVTLDFMEAARGCQRELEFPRAEPCETCGGNGAKPGTQPETCDYCGGSGQVGESMGFFQIARPCNACGGAGTVVRQKCIDCTGTGRIKQTVTVEIELPPGVDNGHQLPVRGEGEAGLGGGPRGDLVVAIRVRPHPLFERDGEHLHCEVPVTYTQMALGTKVEVPTLEGKRELDIAAGTQPGTVVRIRGEGMHNPIEGGKGDLHVHLQLEVPKKVDGRHEELLRELAEIEEVDVTPHRKGWFERLTEYFTGQPEE